MKISGWTILALISVTLMLTDSAVAQKKAITRSEYSKAVYSQLSWGLGKRIHRIETLEESFENGVVVKSQTTIYEGLPPDRSRYYTKTIANGKVTEFERITIDYMLYTRKDGGAWTKIDLRQQGGTGSGSGSGASGSIACSQYSVENTFLEGIATKLFESVQVTEEASELKFEEERNWLDEEGLTRRIEQVRGKLYPRVEQNRRIVTYDYNPDLKIEAPIN
jgi:hypothetical protein